MVTDMRHDVIEEMVGNAIPANSYAEQWDMEGLGTQIRHVLAVDLPVADWAKEEGIAEPEIEERVRQASDSKMAEKAANYGPELMRMVEKSLLLQLLDQIWKDHLLTLDHLRQGISLRAYGQRDPLREYQTEAFELFQSMQHRLRETVTRALAVVEVQARPSEQTVVMHPRAQEMRESAPGSCGSRRRSGHGPTGAGHRNLWRRLCPRHRQSGARRHGTPHAAGRRHRRPEQSGDLGQGRPQRRLSLRLGQEVQALPRRGLTPRGWSSLPPRQPSPKCSISDSEFDAERISAAALAELLGDNVQP